MCLEFQIVYFWNVFSVASFRLDRATNIEAYDNKVPPLA